MEKIFTVVEVPEEKKVNIRTYYLTGEADIWWNTVKDKLVWPEFTWSKFLEELRAKFYPIVVQRQKEKEFMQLKVNGNMTMMQYASKFTELSRFVLELLSSKRLKMRRFKQGSAVYIQNELAGQPILTYQELYERATEVEQVKIELRALNLINQKRKGFEQGTLSKSVNQKKPSPTPPKSHPAGSTEPYAKCRRTHHTTPECRVGTNKCMWCGQRCSKTLGLTLPKGPSTKACSRTGVCNEQEGSCHL